MHAFSQLFNHSFTHSLIHSFIHSTIQPFNHSFIHSTFQPFNQSIIHSFIHLITQPFQANRFNHSLIQSFSQSAMQAFSHSIIQPFNIPCTPSSLYSRIPSLLPCLFRLFFPSFIHSFKLIYYIYIGTEWMMVGSFWQLEVNQRRAQEKIEAIPWDDIQAKASEMGVSMKEAAKSIPGRR